MNTLDNLDYGAIQNILSGISSHPKKKRGPPLGSKNKKKDTKLVVSVTAPPKKCGPPSKKNKPGLNTFPIKKSPGRPKGSPNRGPSKTTKNMTAACTIQKYFRRYQIINTFATIYS